MSIQVGDLVTIVMCRELRLIGEDALVIGALTKRQTDALPSYLIRTQDGMKWYATPHAIRGPLRKGRQSIPARWPDCVWQPKEISR